MHSQEHNGHGQEPCAHLIHFQILHLRHFFLTNRLKPIIMVMSKLDHVYSPKILFSNSEETSQNEKKQ